MRNSISKTIIAGLAALAMSVAVVAETTPASAAQWHGGGFGGGWHGGGFGGWHGGGWGGGWRPGWGGGAWRGGGWGWRGAGWRGGCWNCGWNNGWWGPAVVGGLALGAVASSPYWGGYGYDNGYGYGGDSGCWALRRTWDGWGRYLGRRWVNLCQ